MSGAQSTQDATENLRSKLEEIVETKAYVNDLEMVPWYTKELEEPKPAARDLFESYSKVPSADVVAHIKHVRDEAFKIVSSSYYCVQSNYSNESSSTHIPVWATGAF